MNRPAPFRAVGATAAFRIAGCAFLLLFLQSTNSSTAQPFRTQTVPPASPSLEAQQAFHTTLGAQARLLKGVPRPRFVPEHERQALIEFMVGNVLFAAIHEMGFAVLSELNLPALTGVEQAADDFAILTALELGKKDFADRILMDGAKGWFTSVRRKKRARDPPSYYDRHGFDERRAYRNVCLMVGADPVRFKALAEETALPKEMKRSCGWEYDRASRSWDSVLMRYRPAADKPKTKIQVIYHEAVGELGVYRKIFQNLKFLEIIAEHAADHFAWPAPIVMEMRRCGVSGAKWTTATRAIHICYEMARDLAQIYRDREGDR